MAYFIIITIIGIIVLLEMFVIRKGSRAGRRAMSYTQRGYNMPSAPHPNQNKRISQESSETLEDHVSFRTDDSVFPTAQENVMDFSEESLRSNSFSGLRTYAPEKERHLDQSAIDIIQEIRGAQLQPPSPAIEEDVYDDDMEEEEYEVYEADEDDGEYEEVIEEMESEREIELLHEDAEQDIGEVVDIIDESTSPLDIPDVSAEDASPDGQLKLGIELIKEGKLDEGIRQIEAVIEEIPDKADAHFNLGIAYSLKDNIPQAIQAYQHAIKTNDRYGKAFFNLGTLYLKQNSTPKAIEYLEKAVKLLPDSMKALWNLYEAYRSSELFTKALSTLKQLVGLEPEDATLHNHLGICYVKLGDYRKAIDAWQQAITLGASSQLIYYNLGKTYELCGDFSAAEEHYHQFLTLASHTSDWEELVNEVQDRLENLQS